MRNHQVSNTYPWLIQPFVENGRVKYRVHNVIKNDVLPDVYEDASDAQLAAEQVSSSGYSLKRLEAGR